jgi:hypothetical protein
MTFSGSMRAEADCFPIIRPDEYRGPEPKPGTYEGRPITVNREPFRLGPKVVFKAREPTVPEWRLHLKILYVEGGVFASKPTYADFLDSLTTTGSLAQSEAAAMERTEFGGLAKPALAELLPPKPTESFAQLSFKL